MKIIRFLLILVALTSVVFVGCSKKSDGSPTSSSYSGPYIGNVNSLIFHKDTCSYLPDTANRISFSKRQDAINAGYTPCGHCNP
jgi:competence protein ComEC